MDADEDEFEDFFDGAPLDDKAEQSLADLEATYSTQRQSHEDLPHSLVETSGYEAKDVGGIPTGVNGNHARTSKPRPGVDDFRISHAGPPVGHNLPNGDDFDEDGEEDAWGKMDLDRAESEAISLSQQSHPVSRPREPSEGDRVNDLRGIKRIRRNDPAEANLKRFEPLYRASNDRDGTSIYADEHLQRIAELEKLIESRDSELLRMKRDKQAKEGEASLLRTNLNKATQEFSNLLREKEGAISKHKELAEQLRKTHQEEMSRAETINAFRQTELATTSASNNWASITASAQRRRRGPISILRDRTTQSHSQAYAENVGLTTPTRKGRIGHRTLGSGGSQGSGGDRRRVDDRAGTEDSPSRRLEKRQSLPTATPQTLDSSVKSKKSTPLPGLVNSFAEPAPRLSSRKKSSVHRRRSDEEVFQDDLLDQQVPDLPTASEIQDIRDDVPSIDTGQTENPISGWSIPRQRYLWAVSTYSRRQAFLASLVLSHRRIDHVANGSADSVSPSQIRVSPSAQRWDSGSSTLHKILNVSFPPQTPLELQHDYMKATDYFLQVLSQGVSMDAESRFVYLLNQLDSDNITKSSKERSELQEEEFWDVWRDIDDGVDEVLSQVGSCLKMLADIAAKLGMAESLLEVLTLLRMICAHHPSMMRNLTLEGFLFRPRTMDLAPMTTQVQAATFHRSIWKLEGHFEDVLIACIRKLSSHASVAKENDERQTIASTDQERVETDFSWAPSGHLSEELFSVIESLFEHLAWDMLDEEMYQVRKMIDTPGIIFALLSPDRLPPTICRTLRTLVYLCQHERLWRHVVGCQPNKALQQKISTLARGGQTPLLLLLADHMAKPRAKPEDRDAHKIHCDVVGLLSQLVLNHDDALLIISQSDSILASIIHSIQSDTSMIWNELGEGIDQREVRIVDVVERICADVRLLHQLYYVDSREKALLPIDETGSEQRRRKRKPQPADLNEKLNVGHDRKDDRHPMLHGVRFSILLGLGRIAYAREPDWIQDEERLQLHGVEHLANDLLDLMLTPQENESLYESLAEEGYEDDTMEEDENEEEQRIQRDFEMMEEESLTQADDLIDATQALPRC